MQVVQVGEAVSFRPEKMSKVGLFDCKDLFLDLCCLEPGQEQKVHAHADATKVYYVLDGEGTFTVGAEEKSLGPGHANLAPPGEDHGVRNGSGSRLMLLVTMAPNPNFK